MRGGEPSRTTRARRVADELEALALKALRRQERVFGYVRGQGRLLKCAQSAKTARIFRNTITDRERDDARSKARNNGKYSRLRRRAWVNTRSCHKICVMKGSFLLAPTKRHAAKTLCRRKRRGDAFLQKVMGNRAFELWKEEGSAHFFKAKAVASQRAGEP